MSRTHAVLKAELEAQAAQLIEDALAWSFQAKAPTLHATLISARPPMRSKAKTWN